MSSSLDVVVVSLSLSFHVFVCLVRSRLHVGGTSVNGRDGSRGGFGPHVVHQDSSNMFFAPRRACCVPRVCVQDPQTEVVARLVASSCTGKPED